MTEQLRFEILVSNEYLAEELGFECHPFQTVVVEVCLFIIRACRTEFVCIVFSCTVGDGAITVFEVETLLLLTHVLVPYDIERLGLRREESVKILRCNRHVEDV